MTDAARLLRKRHAAERRFRLYGRVAIVIALGFLAILLGRVVAQGYTTFLTHSISLPVYLDPAKIDAGYPEGANFDALVADSVLARVGGGDAGKARDILSRDLGFQLLDAVKNDQSRIGQNVVVTGPIGADAGLYLKGEMAPGKLDDQQLAWLDRLKADGVVKAHFNTGFFTRSDSTEPEQAGVLGAIVGSAMMLLVTALISVPIGVLGAIWLEEFAPKNRWTTLVEVNINNLAAVPSIVYGLLGLALFINWLGAPRSAPLTGGLVLALMALPTIIIATRSALKAVPPSVREAALALGASRTQTVFHHVAPQAGAGIMTGIILSLAHALGETAPLLMIGMVAFVPGVPESFTGPASVLPVQVFIWENAAERAFHERTAAAIMVLLAFMIAMNAAAVILRSRLERRW